MVDNFPENTNQPSFLNSFFQSFKRKIAVLFLLLIVASCQDQGCIEADDFGEYEYQVIEVKANGSAQSCAYDYSLAIDDPAQGEGLKYLTTGSVTVDSKDEFDSNGKSINYSNDGQSGCSYFAQEDTNHYNEKIKRLCIEMLIEQCHLYNNASAGNADPGWTSTDERDSSQNFGVTIYPDSEIKINVSGTVRLGENIDYLSHYVSPKQMLPDSHPKDWRNATNTDWQDQFFDVREGQTLTLKFSGQWDSGTTQVGGGSAEISGTDIAADKKIYDGAKKTIVYLRTLPTGYEFDNTQTTEAAGTKGTPLVPSPDLWQCSYPTANPNQPSCSNKSYKTIYTNSEFTDEDDTLAKTIYPVTADEESSILTYHGGMIRWKDDGLQSSNYDPFSGSTTPTSIAQGGVTLQDLTLNLLTDSYSLRNSENAAYKVYFRSTDSQCNIPLTVSIQEDNVKLESYKSRTYDPGNITLTNNWSTYDLALEKDQDLVIANITALNTQGGNCSQNIQIKFIKYHEITLTQSGLVSFTMLNGSSGSQCVLKGSIINPRGSHLNETIDSIALKADFYEYDPLSSDNPLKELEVDASLSSNAIHTWTDPIFVRKGQTIRFNPESWSGSWVEEGLKTVQCGIGMAMKIEARPALLCRGEASSLVDNPQCVQDYDTNGKLIGCVADHEDCYDDTSLSYCPKICQADITCTAAKTDINEYFKTNCSIGTYPTNSTTASGCAYSTTAPQINAATCQQCANAMLDNAKQSAKINQTTSQCYNLENYKGKVENIRATNSTEGFTSANLDNTDIAKGAVLLGNFNGTFGNLDGFSISKKVDSDHGNNIIYQLRSPLIFSQGGRLQFFLLDGEDFKNIKNTYSDNSDYGTNYSGSNGMRIDLSGALEFFNGEMMSARLCSTDNGGVCRGSTNPTAIEPKIVEYGTTSTEQIDGNYQYLSSGMLVRKTAPDMSFDCGHSSNPEQNNTTTTATSSFYCHIGGDEAKKYRLTFKIIDSETGNCDITTVGGTANDGIIQENPYYVEDNATAGITGHTGQFCDLSVEKPYTIVEQNSTLTTCKKEFYCANRYINNSGSYQVTVKVKKPDGSNISNVIGGVVNPVIEVLDGPRDGSQPGQAERIYSLLIADGKYQLILSIALTLMITFYGLSSLMGVSELTHSELLNRLIKIGVIYLFVSPGGWYWFNELFVGFFKDGTDYLAFMMASSFDNSESISSALENGDYYDKAILFESVDQVFGLFFSDAVQKKVSALLFADIFGVVYLWIIYLAFMLYVYAVCNAVLLYLTAQVFITLLFIIGPLFFIFLLFGQTKDMFDNWLKQLISFSLQQIFLLTTLAFFNMMMYEVLKMSLGYKVCWDVVWTIKVFGPVIELMSFWTIPKSIPEAGQLGNPDSNIPSLFTILFIWVVASLMNKFISFMTDVAASISGGLKASELGDGVSKAFSEVSNYAKSRSSDIYKGSIGKQVERLDMKLFDSGKLASDARRKRREQHTKDEKNKGEMRNAGNEAVESYKKEHGANLAKLSPEEQKRELDRVKDEAIKSKGIELGLNDAQIEKLRKSKGSTYEGANAFGLALHTARQAVSSGGTLTKSIDDEKTKTSFSKSQAKSATKAKRMTNEERKDFMDAVKSGKIQVERGTLGKMKGALGSVKHSAQRGTMTQDAISSIKNAPSAVFDKTKGLRKTAANAVGKGDYRKAEQELMKEGIIAKTSQITSFARTDEEKDLIRQRMTDNRQTAVVTTDVKDKDGNVIKQDQTISMKAYRKAEKQLEAEGKLKDHKSFEERQQNTEEMKDILDRIAQNKAAAGPAQIDYRAAASVIRKAEKRSAKEDIQKAKEKAVLAEGAEKDNANKEVKKLQREYSDKYSNKFTRGGSTFRRTDKKDQKREIRDEMLRTEYDQRKENTISSDIRDAYKDIDMSAGTDDITKENIQERQDTAKITVQKKHTQAVENNKINLKESQTQYNQARKEERNATIKSSAAGLLTIASLGLSKTAKTMGEEARNTQNTAKNKRKEAQQNISKYKKEGKELQKQERTNKEFEEFHNFETVQPIYEESKEKIISLKNQIESSSGVELGNNKAELAYHENIVSSFDKQFKKMKTATKGKRLNPKEFNKIIKKAEKKREETKRKTNKDSTVERENDANNQSKRSRFSFSFGKKKNDSRSLLENEGGNDED